MFQSICIRRQHNDDISQPVDLGFLAEAMLFYENVHLITDASIVEQLLRQCGAELLVELLDEKFLQISYLENMTGIKTENTGTKNETHRPVTITYPAMKLQEMAPTTFQKIIGKSGRGRRLGNQFAERVQPIAHGNQIIPEVRDDYADKTYIQEAIIQLLQVIAPEYHIPTNFFFDIRADGDALAIDTNLDLALQGGNFNLRTPSGPKPISPASLLVALLDVRSDLHFSSHYGSEIATSSASSALIQVKFHELLRARSKDEKNIEDFQILVLNNAYAIREAINSGERSYKDLLALLDKARRFKDWLQKQAPDANLIHEYYQEVTASTWVEKLPVKTSRWTILTLLGFVPIIGPIAGIPLSAADTFLLDRLAIGWRPNQFVDEHLKPFAKVH